MASHRDRQGLRDRQTHTRRSIFPGRKTQAGQNSWGGAGRAGEILLADHSGGWIFADSNSAAVSVGVATRARARALNPLPFRYATRSSASSSVVSGHVAGGGGDADAAERCGRPQCGMGGCVGLG